MNHDDLVILGSGSTACAAALTAAERGKRVVMTEVRTFGIRAEECACDLRNPQGIRCHENVRGLITLWHERCGYE